MTVSGVCKKLKVTRQGYYKALMRAEQQTYHDYKVGELIAAQRKLLPRLGGRKVYHMIREDLEGASIKMGRDKLFNYMRKQNLLIRPKKRFTSTTNSKHRFYIYNNLLQKVDVERKDQVWVSDITYLATREGFCYLALITDLYSRKIIGYDISDSLELNGAMRALNMAIKNKQSKCTTIHHSDRGIQYCSYSYTAKLKSAGMLISMADKGNCYQNAAAERLNGILKNEFNLDVLFKTKKMAVKTSIQSIKLYNELRPHMALNYKNPKEVYQ